MKRKTDISFRNPYGNLSESIERTIIYSDNIAVKTGVTFEESIALLKRNTFRSIGTAVNLPVNPVPEVASDIPDHDDEVEYTEEDDSYFNSITYETVDIETDEDEETESDNLLDNEFEIDSETVSELQSKLSKSSEAFEPLLYEAAGVLVGLSESSDKVKAVLMDQIGIDVELDSSTLDILPVLTNLSLTLKVVERLNLPKKSTQTLISTISENVGINISKMLSSNSKSKELTALYKAYSSKLKDAGLEDDVDESNLLGVRTSRR